MSTGLGRGAPKTVVPVGFRSRPLCWTGAAPAAAGGSTAGGMVIIASTAAAIAVPSIRTTALPATVPLPLAAGATVLFGVQTGQRRLAEVSGDRTVGSVRTSEVV